MKRSLGTRIAWAALALGLPISALADLSATKTLTSTQSLNLDTGATASSGGDILWNGSSLTPQGTAKAAVMPGVSFDAVNQIVLQTFLPVLGSSAAIPSSSLPAGTVIAVTTIAGHPAKVLVTAISASSITLQFTTYGAASGGGGGGGGPIITKVLNNSSEIPAGFPNSGISPSSLFKIRGTGLANAIDTDNHSSEGAGLQTSLNGASIAVTIGATTVRPAIYYAGPSGDSDSASAVQLTAVLPVSTPTGAGTVTVTYNGATSNAFPIQVIAAAPGISTYANGTAIAQDLSRSSEAYGGLVTFTKSVAPSQLIILWGTGFGARGNSDTTYDTSAHQTSTPLTVFVGGVQVTNMTYKGASVYPGVDVLVLAIPPNAPSSCYVPIVVVANGNIVSNTGTLPIKAGGGACSDPLLGITGDQISTLTGKTTLKTGGVNVIQTTSPGVGGAASTSSFAGASFFQVTGASYAGGSGNVSAGGCIVSQIKTSGTGGTGGTATGLDAGTITVAPPGGSPITLTGIPSFPGIYSATLSSIPSTGGAFVFHGSGGSQVGSFNATVNFPNPLLTWTNQGVAATVNRSQGLLVTWDGGAPGTYVNIFGNSIDVTGGVSGSYTCIAPVEAKQFTVPSYVLLTLPVSSGGASSTSVQNYTTPSQFSASGLDYAGALGIVQISVTSNYN